MILKRLKHSEIDFEKWDNVILNSELPLVFAQSFYLNATAPKWEALVINDYETVFPLTEKRKFGFTYLPQPPFTSQLGAFGIITAERERLFYDFIVKHYNLIEIELNQTNHIQSAYRQTKNTFVINYDKGFSYNQNTKRNIAKALNAGLSIKEINTEHILKLSQVYLNPFLQSEFKLSVNSIQLFNALVQNSIQNSYIKTFSVIDSNGDIRALAHFLCNGKHALFLKGTNFDRNENSGSMHFLLDYAINYYKDKASIFDFGGGSNSSGLAGFYKGFGSEQFDYGYLKINSLPRIVKFLKKQVSK